MQPLPQQYGQFGETTAIHNRTLNVTAFGSTMELGFAQGGDLNQYFKSANNSSLGGKYFLNASSNYGLVSSGIDLEIVKLKSTLEFPWTGITVKISEAKIEASDPYLFLVPNVAYYELNTTSNTPWTKGGVSIQGFLMWGKEIPVNETVQFWVNFTITPVAELGWYYVGAEPIPVSITWNLTFVSIAPKLWAPAGY